jgi:hypothetical protein
MNPRQRGARRPVRTREQLVSLATIALGCLLGALALLAAILVNLAQSAH